MDFCFINRRGGTRSVWCFNTNDGFAPGWDSGRGGGLQTPPSTWTALPSKAFQINNNQMMDVGLDWSNMKFYMQGADTVGPFTFPAQNQLVITNSGKPDQMFVNLNAVVQQVENDLKGNPNAQPAQGGDGADIGGQVASDIASAVLNGLTTAVSTLGDEAFGAAGVLGALTSLAGSLGSSLSPANNAPQPPNLASIKKALTNVENLNNARMMGSFFQALYLWFTRKAQDIAYYGKPNRPVPAKLEADFMAAVSDELDPKDSSSFYSTLLYVSSNPDVGKYMLSHFLIAVGLYIHLMRINLGQTYIPYAQQQKTNRGVFPPSEINGLKNDVKTFRDGLDKARKAFIAMRGQTVEKSGLAGIPEALFIIKAVTKCYVGDPYALRDEAYATAFPNGTQVTYRTGTAWVWNEQGYAGHADPTTAALSNLKQVYDAIEKDADKAASGAWPQHLLNVDWKKVLGTAAGA